MNKHLRLRVWIEGVVGIASALSLALTLVWPDWIERGFGWEPDGSDGSVEWGLVLLLATLAFGAFGLAWREGRRLARA